jgi:hypothetical protein
VTRVWLTCALATAAVVVAVLLVTDRPDAEADGPPARRPASPLSEQEVRTYLEVMPRYTEVTGRVALEYQRQRQLNPGKPDTGALAARVGGEIDALLEKRHLTRETWRTLEQRVEYVVNAVRGRQQFDEERAGMEERLAMKKALLGKLAPNDRAGVEEEIRNLETLLKEGGPPVLEQDVALVRQFWAALDAVVPTRGPPRKK